MCENTLLQQASLHTNIPVADNIPSEYYYAWYDVIQKHGNKDNVVDYWTTALLSLSLLLTTYQVAYAVIESKLLAFAVIFGQHWSQILHT